MWHKDILSIIFVILFIGFVNIEAHHLKNHRFPSAKPRLPLRKWQKPNWIKGGKVALPGEFTYAVSLQFDETDKCGGGLISNRFVITAAHCVIDENGEFFSERPTVLMNVIDLYADEISENQVEVAKIYVLKDYDPQVRIANPIDRVVADIAVLKLKDSDKKLYSYSVKLKLPEKLSESYTGVNATIVGFGWDDVRTYTDRITKKQYESGQSSGQLRHAETEVISNEKCSQVMNTIRDSNICARVRQRQKDYGEGVCSGDSGGPLVYGRTLIGVLSSSPFGCEETVGSGVYTRVSSFLDFIQAAIRDDVSDNIRAKDYTINTTKDNFDYIKT